MGAPFGLGLEDPACLSSWAYLSSWTYLSGWVRLGGRVVLCVGHVCLSVAGHL